MRHYTVSTRDGVSASNFAQPSSILDLNIELDHIDLDGEIAHERDCLSFMLAGWPEYKNGNVKEYFTKQDVCNQIQTMRKISENEDLNQILDHVEQYVIKNGATFQ